MGVSCQLNPPPADGGGGVNFHNFPQTGDFRCFSKKGRVGKIAEFVLKRRE